MKNLNSKEESQGGEVEILEILLKRRRISRT
jgi:hypothetical protein